ncbi:hypothetical protein BDD12DRAFT_735065 [Trichophaea hybrida]|nr:hypothetical protein BDD12DRAFT_735065 [Trichophaea hybrida]
MGVITDWISATCSLVAALVALATLVTVFVAAEQIVSRRHIYRLGLSVNSLGPWKETVLSESFFSRFKLRIRTPTVNVPKLVSERWDPKLTFPMGFVIAAPKKAIAIDSESQGHHSTPMLADSSWVNFLQAVGLTPDSSEFYDLQSQPELVNGIVPMRWKGKDLVALCSMLGFQSSEDKPSPTTPMPLPVQWSGLLGWMQFRASSDGCIVEFRRRAPFSNQLSKTVHEFYERGFERRPVRLISRLWYSVDGLSLPDEGGLFLGGADKNERSQDRENTEKHSTDKLFEKLMERDREPEDIRRTLWGGKSKQPGALRPEAFQKGLSQLSQASDMRNSKSNDNDKTTTVRVMKPCPGLLSIIVEREHLYGRGLSFDNCHEWRSVYTDDDEVNDETHPYNLGNIYMGGELLELMKKAVLYLEPDGFYFTSVFPVLASFRKVWEHVQEPSDWLENILPPAQIEQWYLTLNRDTDSKNVQLYHAMVLCNELQHIRKKQRAIYTIDDMIVLSKSSLSLRKMVATNETRSVDLVWALIVSQPFFADILQRFRNVDLKTALAYSITISNGVIDCNPLRCPEVESDPKFNGRYPVPCVADGNFPVDCVLAALIDVFLTYFWIEKGCASDIDAYDSTIPQSVTMC